MPKIAAGATNKNINIAPHGTGKVVVGTGAADATVQSDGDYNLILQTGNSTTSKIEITDGANGDVAVTPNGTGNLTIDNIAISDNTIISTDTNGNIAITPNGTGEVDISKVDIDGGTVDGITLGTNSAVTAAQIDNINIDGNAITSTNTNGNIDLTPAGTGAVNISKVDIDGGAIDATDVTVGSGKTLNVSAGSLTTSTAQKQAIVDGSSIEGTDILSTGESGKFLGADGDDSSSWQTIGGTLPSQTGNANKLLTTDASSASWTATHKMVATTDGIQTPDGTAVLSVDGSNVATLKNVTLDTSVVYPAGHVLQVESYTETTTQTTTSATFADMSGLEDAITPASGNHVLIHYDLMIGSENGYRFLLQLWRDGPGTSIDSIIKMGAAAGVRQQVLFQSRGESDSQAVQVAGSFLDTAIGTGGIIRYYFKWAAESASTTLYLNRTYVDTDGTTYGRGASTITLMEIQA